MEDRAHAEYNQQQYEHEVLAEFGTEEMGVFDKNALDEAREQLFYTYEPLTNLQIRRLGDGKKPLQFIFNDGDRAPQNMYRTVGVKNSPIVLDTLIA